MAQYAYNYNDIYDDYIVKAAPKTAPVAEEKQAQPELRRIGRTKEQVIKENQKKFKIALAKISVIAAAFIAVISMAVMSQAQLNSAKQQLADANAAYQQSLEQNNELKLQLDNMLAGVNIDKIAKENLGLQKIPDKRKIMVDISKLQQ